VRTAFSIIRRVLLGVLFVAATLGLYFVCQGMFAGYPKYHTDILSMAGMALIAAIGGIAWIGDERRSDADD
jgi:hypothetical protein